MKDSLFFEGKEYISAKRGANEIGYASDYIGQLCRAKKIPSRLVGRTWYVERESLIEHKQNNHAGKIKTQIIYETENLPRLPELTRKILPKKPLFSATLVKESLAISLGLLVAVSAGLATLEQTNPKTLVQVESLSAKVEEQVSASVLEGVNEVIKTIIAGFNNLKDFAFNRVFIASEKVPEAKPKTQTTQNTNKTQSTKPESTNENVRPPLALTTPGPAPITIDSLRTDLKRELENYVRAQIGTALAPQIIYQSGPTINTPILRQEILLADTRPTVTRQSSSDIDHGSSVLSRLSDGGTLTNSTLTGATLSGPLGSFTNFTFSFATGTSATTTNFFSTTASSTSLFFTTGNGGNFTSTGLGTFANLLLNGSSTLQNFTFANATGTNATTTNFFSTTASSTNLFSASANIGTLTTAATTTITGAFAGITFSGTGNHDITATGGTLRIGSNTIIGNIEALDDTVDIGTAGVRFDKIYANEVNATTLVGTLTGGNLVAETFTINSDNATVDTEDANLSFERGSTGSSPNALMTWNSARNEFQFNSGMRITNTIGATTTLILDSGSLGIATSTPYAQFAVVSNGTSGTVIAADAISGFSGTLFDLKVASSTKFSVNQAGDLYLTGSTTLQNFTFVNATGTNATTTNFFSTTASSTNLFSSLLTVGGTGLVVDSSRNVGIGTTSPGTKLTVVGGINFTGNTLKSGSADWDVLAEGAITTFDADTNNDQTGEAFRFTIHNGATEWMRITNGNVGIATSTPYAQFAVVSNGTSGTVIAADAISGYSGTLFDLKVASSTKFSVNQAGDLYLAGSTTLQNFTFVNATGTSATTTNFFATTASSTNLLSTSLNTGAITSGLINSQTISSVADFTGTLNVATGFKIGNAAASGKFLRGNGTNYIASTATLADTYGASELLYSNGANTVQGLTTAASSVLVTNSSSVPAWTTTLPAFTLGGAITGNSQSITGLNNLTGTTLEFTRSTTTNATTTNFFSTTASSTNLLFTTGNGGHFTSTGLGTFANLLLNGSTTLQNLTFVNATGTSATTTNLFSTTASSTNLFSAAANFGALTVQALTATRVPFAGAGGLFTDDSDLTFSTDTLSATKLLSSTSVSTPSLISTGAITMTPGAGTNFNLSLSTTGDFAVNTNQLYVDTSAGFVGIATTSPYAKFSVVGGTSGTVIGVDTITGYSGNILELKVASSTKFSVNQAGDLYLTGSTTLQNFTFVNATGTNATTTNFFSTTASSTNLFSSLLTVGGTGLVVDSSRNVGIGTTGPAQRLDVLAGQNAEETGYGTIARLGDTTAYNSSPLIGLSFRGKYNTAGDYASFGAIQVGKTNATDDNYSGFMSFWTRNNGAAPLERMRIDSTGNVGIGTTSPATLLEVGGSTANVTFDGYKSCTGFTSNGNGLLACTASDERLKQDILSLDNSNGLDAINALNPVSFYWNPGTERGTNQQFGLVAQQVRDVFPNLVVTSSPTALTPDGTLSVNYEGLISPIILAIQELYAEFLALKETVLAFADKIISKEIIVTNQICIGNTCVNEQQLQAMLANTGTVTVTENMEEESDTVDGGAASGESTASESEETATDTSVEETTTTEETVEEEASAEEVTPEPESESVSEPEPDSTPEPVTEPAP